MMPAGSRGFNIWVLSTSFQKSNIAWPQQRPTENVLKSNMIFHDSTKTSFFQNIKVKPNSRTWMTLKSSVVWYPGLRTSATSMTSTISTASVASMTSTASFQQNIYSTWWFDHPYYPNDQYEVLFCEMDHQKFNFLLIFNTLSVGGCWGQPMLLFLKTGWLNSHY